MSQTLDVLDRLVGFPTISSASNLPLIDFVQDYLVKRGFKAQRISDSTGDKAGLIARMGPDGPGGIMLSAHSDVVPVEGQDWSSDPFRLRAGEGRVFGRGTTDMKGFAASSLAAADRAARRDLAKPLQIILSWDEEVGCLGIPQMLPHLNDGFGAPDLCIVGEPTEMQVATGHKGKALLKATCTGVAGHSALAPDYMNALHLAGDFLLGLRNLQDDIATNGPRDDGYGVPYTTLHVGRMSGGTALNIVPDTAEIDLEFRHLAAHLPETLHAQIRTCAENAVAPHRARFPQASIHVETTGGYPGLDVSVDAPEVARLQALAGGTDTCKVAYGTEAGHLSAAGIPTLVCGPGSMEQGHKADEFIALEQLAACDAMMDRVLDVLTS